MASGYRRGGRGRRRPVGGGGPAVETRQRGSRRPAGLDTRWAVAGLGGKKKTGSKAGGTAVGGRVGEGGGEHVVGLLCLASQSRGLLLIGPANQDTAHAKFLGGDVRHTAE